MDAMSRLYPSIHPCDFCGKPATNGRRAVKSRLALPGEDPAFEYFEPVGPMRWSCDDHYTDLLPATGSTPLVTRVQRLDSGCSGPPLELVGRGGGDAKLYCGLAASAEAFSPQST